MCFNNNYNSLAIFLVLGQEKIASLISTDDQSLFVMDNSTMRWATQLPFSPLVIKRGSFMVEFFVNLTNSLLSLAYFLLISEYIVGRDFRN